MTNRCFINSLAQVSCQKPLSDEWFDSPFRYEESFVRAQEPDTKGIIAPLEARRMSKILKRAASTAITALERSAIQHPEAIISGTGMGCLENSEKFLVDLCHFGENSLKPTLFMQSTHNTISSQIAIMLKCHGYNNTYSHKGISFESALFDAWLQMKGGVIANALVAGNDEVTPFMASVMRHTHPESAFVSETSVSAVLTNDESLSNICEVADVRLIYKPKAAELADLLSSGQDDVLLLGVNGSEQNDEPYEELLKALNYKPQTLQYKNIFGENFSASALSVYVGALILKNRRIPDFLCRQTDSACVEDIKGVTILNHSEGSAWSLVRLKTV